MELNLLGCRLCAISCKQLHLWKPFLLPVVAFQGNAFMQGAAGGRHLASPGGSSHCSPVASSFVVCASLQHVDSKP